LSSWNIADAGQVSNMFVGSGKTNEAYYPVGCTCDNGCRNECS
jgi:hypothetical protein